jgi:F-type H+-transporting ATPase subunit delta
MKANRRTKQAARGVYRLCLVNGVLDEGRARQAATYLAKSDRRRALALLEAFQRLLRLDRDRHSALVESAVPLADSVRAQVTSGLAHAYGKDVAASFAENPALIAGLRIKVGSDVYDGSVRARLAALQSRL